MSFQQASRTAPQRKARALDRLGRYTLLHPLGKGGMGTIHVALATGVGAFRKLLAIKELRRDLAHNDTFIEMFLAEAKLAARLNHPNIVQTIEAGQDGDRYFLAMEFLDGQPFSRVLRRAALEPVMPMAMRVQVLCEVLAGLHYAHELCDFDGSALHVAHRDVGPQNVFVTYHGQVKLLDFGIAKAVDNDGSTSAGVFKGKFAYAAPEQVRGGAIDGRSDVFAVGVMLWEALAQQRFAPARATDASISARLAGGEPRLSQVVSGAHPTLASICDRALQVDPAARYPTAEAFRSDLNAFLHEHAEQYPPEQIGQTLRGKFAVERQKLHRVLRARLGPQLAHDDAASSIVRALSASESTRPSYPARVLSPASSPDDPPLGNPSKWIESNRLDNPAGSKERGTRPSRAGKLPRRNEYLLWLSLVAVVAFAAAYVGVRNQGASVPPPIGGPALQVGVPPSTRAAPRPATIATAEPSPVQRSRAGEPPDSEAVESESEPSSAPERRVGPRGHAARGLPKLKPGRAARRYSAQRRSLARRGPSSSGEQPSAASRRPLVQARARDSLPTAALPAHRVQVGDDLRPLRHQRPARRPQLEDPFQ